MWKKKLTILKSLRTYFKFSQKIIIAIAILFNFSRMLYHEDDSDDDEDEDDEDHQDSDDDCQSHNLRR